MERFDFAIVGGGIVGLSTALALSESLSGKRIAVFEKERGWGQHQTGRNSGVIHSGIYYAQGSLKARMAREGNRALVAFCRAHGIPYEVCGKLIVASRPRELPALKCLYERGQASGLEISVLNSDQLIEREPHVRGLEAIWVPSTAIVDFRQVAEMFATLLRKRGAELFLGTCVRGLARYDCGICLESNGQRFWSRCLVNCAGLYGDRLARQMGLRIPLKIVPFRGEYYELRPQRRHLVRNLVYPVPHPRFPFLGVHLTRTIGGSILVGPNAVMAFSREGYKRSDFNGRDFLEALTFPGLYKLVIRNPLATAGELASSISKAAFTRRVRALVPEIQDGDLIPAASGVRAQAVAPDGRLVDDFHVVVGHRSIHVCNAPSPAATAAIPIGRMIAQKAAQL